MPNPTVAKSTSQILVANLAKNGALLVALILISRVLGPNDLGNYTLALAITTPAFALGLLGVRIVRITGPNSLSTRSFELALIVSGVVATIISVVFSAVIFSGALIATILVSLFKWSDVYTELYAGSLQHTHQTRRLAYSAVLGSAFVAVVTAIAVVLTKNLAISLVVLAVSGWVFSLGMKLATTQDHARSLSIDVNSVFKFGLPLGLAGAVASLSSTIPQYRVASTLGDSEVGVLAVLLYAYALTDLFSGAYGQAWIPRLKSMLHRQSQRQLTIKVGVLSSLVMIPVATLGLVLFSWAAPLVFGPHVILTLKEAVPLLVAVSLLPLAHVIGMTLFTRMHYNQTLIMMSASAIATALIAFLVVPQLGIAGALWSVVAGAIARVTCACVFLLLGERAAE